MPATLDEEIISAQEKGVLSTLTDAARIARIARELQTGFDALADVGPGRLVLRLGAHAARTTPSTQLARDIGTHRWARPGFAVITGGGPGRDGGRQPRRAATPARSRSGSTSSCRSSRAEPVRRHRPRVPLLLHAQDHVRPLRERVRGLPRRLRHARRARSRRSTLIQTGKVRHFPVVLVGATTGAGWSTGSANGSWPRGRSRREDLDLICLTDDPLDVRDRLMSAAHRQARTSVRSAP